MLSMLQSQALPEGDNRQMAELCTAALRHLCAETDEPFETNLTETKAQTHIADLKVTD